MDSDRIEGPLKEAGGKVKEEWGDATDDAQTEAEGKADQVEGDVQNKWGETKTGPRRGRHRPLSPTLIPRELRPSTGPLHR